jgi:hypothetical protein
MRSDQRDEGNDVDGARFRAARVDRAEIRAARCCTARLRHAGVDDTRFGAARFRDSDVDRVRLSTARLRDVGVDDPELGTARSEYARFRSARRDTASVGCAGSSAARIAVGSRVLLLRVILIGAVLRENFSEDIAQRSRIGSRWNDDDGAVHLIERALLVLMKRIGAGLTLVRDLLDLAVLADLPYGCA